MSKWDALKAEMNHHFDVFPPGRGFDRKLEVWEEIKKEGDKLQEKANHWDCLVRDYTMYMIPQDNEKAIQQHIQLDNKKLESIREIIDKPHVGYPNKYEVKVKQILEVLGDG